MTRNNLFPCFGIRVRRRVQRSHARFTLSAFACLFYLCVAGLFTTADAQTNTMRPVARLITATSVGGGGARSTSREEVCEMDARMMPASMSSASASRPRTARVVASREEQRAFELINAERRRRGESQLVWDSTLTRMARLHSENMARQNFFDHTDPQGQNTFMRARTCGVCGWSALAENIAYNSGYDDPAAFAVERWLNSTKHRANILREGFTHSGIGVARAADGRIFFTQVFVTR